MKLFKLLLLVGLFAISCGGGDSSIESGTTNTLYDKVLESNTIRAAYIPYPPAVIKDPNTAELSGIFVDVFTELSNNLGFEIEWVEEVGWGNMIEGLHTNRYDIVVTSVWPNASRSKQVEFSTSLYYSGVGVFVRTDDNRFNADNYEETINSENVTISTMDGEINELIARTQFPEAETVAVPQMSDFQQIIYNVSQNKADVTFVDTYVANQFLEANPGTVKNIVPDNPIRVTPNTYIIKKGEFEFLSMLNTAIDELINTGYVDQIIDEYEKYPGSFYRIDLPYRN